MIVECGFYEIETDIKKRYGFMYFLAKHKCNPRNIELVFIKDGGLKGKEELVYFIKKERLWSNQKI
ncbi:MAG: hypothetical protein C0625_10495 [Arcobacter sp.]|nr:MAG: hypothetical protein C0625_10495 [Arcobacter sp.]